MKELNSPVGRPPHGQAALNTSTQPGRGEELDLTQFQSEGGASVRAESDISYQYGPNSGRNRALLDAP